ncbi:MAG TPA: SMC-Scp complex subunit ScpB [Xanthobacteraceae bacterium]|nr:SMC-Scp complex subunit ScpB [Xanthobacteraceae bacterium]
MSVVRPQKFQKKAPAHESEEALRLLEAILFAAAEPLDEETLKKRLPAGTDIRKLIAKLAETYSGRGVNIVRVAGKWAARTATDLAPLMAKHVGEPKKLSRAAIETLAIVAYHQPVTRAEIEEIRGVTISKGTLDLLIETGWVRLRGRRKTLGRPVTYGTTEDFLVHFGFEAIDDLPGLEELKGAGFLEGRLPAGFTVPVPSDDSALREDEEPLEAESFGHSLAPEAEDEPSEAVEEAEEESAPPATRYDRRRR